MLKFFFSFLLFNAILFAQISPGELTSAHSDLEGLSNCTKCHELGEKVLNSKCLDCHDEIRSLIINGNGYHSSGDVREKDCSKCHSEHFGRNFKIVNFDRDSFDHIKAGYELTGAHIKSACTKCHNPEKISDSKIKNRKGTFLGLNSNCFSCHEDFHQKTLGDNCNACHSTDSFKPAIKFKHENAKYQLTGSHIKVTCIKCHPTTIKNGKDFQKFTGLQYLNCSPCHKDTHQGMFGKVCNNCHVTTDFTFINKKGFDHRKTNYPLLGKHIIVNCDKCHKTGLLNKLEYNKCINCHSDYHKGQFVAENNLRDCKVCHNEYGFHPANYTIEKHNLSKFVLTGAHLATPCESCHLVNKNWEFRNLGLKCVNCHKNIHSNEIVEKYLNNNSCNGCHVTESWNTINFDHKRTEFELFGKHKNQKCGSCHLQQKDSFDKQLLFKSLGKNCEQCHNDVHGGQFKAGKYSDCTRCHTNDNWKPDKFDHEKTKFSLKGTHEKLNCIQCHPVVSSGNNNFIKYKLEEFKCSACHS